MLSIYERINIYFFNLIKSEPLNMSYHQKFDHGSFHKPILAGVSGTAASFLRKNINGVYIFPPNNYKEAIQQIKNIKIDEKNTIDNSIYKSFSRKNIMKKMVNNLLNELIKFRVHCG